MVRIIADSTCALSPEIGQQHGITIVPQLVEFAGVYYQEWLDLTPQAFVEKMRTSSDLPTSTPNKVEVFVEALRPCAEAGESAIFLGPSRRVSKTLEVVEQAAAAFPGLDLRLVDTRMIASTNATLALLAAQWAQEGQSADQIEARILAALPKARAYVLVDTLDYMVRSGRVGGAAGLVGKLFRIKPIVTITDGQVDQFETVLSHRHAILNLQKQVIAAPLREHVCVMHAGVPEEARALVADLAWRLALSEIPIYDIPPTIACHTGPGALGVSFFTEKI